jgi:hypothetical protein
MGSPDHGLRELVNPTPRGLRAWVYLLRRATLVLVAGCLVLGGAALVPVTAQAAGDPCAVPVVNPVACENTRPGTTDWQVSQDASIEGFTTDISTNVGGRVDFKIRTDSPRYTIDIYRLGWYGGDGGRFITSLTPSVPLPQTQPECRRDAASGMVDCGNWGVSASWAVPADAVSGVYVANLRRQDRAAGNQTRSSSATTPAAPPSPSRRRTRHGPPTTPGVAPTCTTATDPAAPVAPTRSATTGRSRSTRPRPS